jgi:diguanylate cyclase (GGDEF)-like protein
MHLSVAHISDTRQLMVAIEENSSSEADIRLLLLDGRLADVANCRLLAALSEPSIRRKWALALLADETSDEWTARLHEGIVDVILPRTVDACAWKMHLTTIERSHALRCEAEQLREASLLEVKRDALTGTLNRDTLLTVLFRETDRIQRHSGSLALMAIDLDGFRHWNQTLGRNAGDQLLREAARRISRLLRTYDVLGRIGGDEFLLILPGCSTVNAVTLAERLRVEVFGEPFWVNTSSEPQSVQSKIAEVRLTATAAITLSRGRSPIVVLREVERILRHAREREPGTILCSGEYLPSAEEAPRLFSEAEILTS